MKGIETPWLARTPAGWTIAIHVQPGAKRSAVAGIHGERLKVRIAAPPIEGRANAAIVAFIAERLGVPRAQVKVARGERSRDKLIEIEVLDCDPKSLLSSEE
ncbi:MAG: DUF167 domain-containing protein [Betaproteobacteria bacterium]|nr:DUF167 domain-containing protein [Betaproteobacteria bacterium]